MIATVSVVDRVCVVPSKFWVGKRLKADTTNVEFLGLSVRNAEIKRLSWANIDFEDRSIVVERTQAKTAGRRVPMQPNLFEWLQFFRTKYPDLPLITGDTRREKKLHKALGYWIDNGMRHSYASYFLGAKLGSYPDLEYAMGNSRSMLEQHYLSFPPKEVSLKYWQIMPKKN